MNIVLVHGSYLGPWTWERVVPGLEARGHRVTAVDLPSSDPAAGGAAYADAIIGAIAWDEPPVIVAHSMSGLITPLVAARREVAKLIFVAAFLAEPGASAGDQRAREPIDAPGSLTDPEFTDLGDGVWSVGARTATELFWHDATPEIAAAASARLRPQAYRVMTETSPLTAWPSVAVASIVCRDDHAINPAWVRSAARERLGVEAVEIDGGHSPMLTRPEELAALLDDLARRTG
jgi:pimeloyl-ACP methyl ester carboxylesterase